MIIFNCSSTAHIANYIKNKYMFMCFMLFLLQVKMQKLIYRRTNSLKIKEAGEIINQTNHFFSVDASEERGMWRHVCVKENDLPAQHD